MSRGDNPDCVSPLTVGGILSGRDASRPLRNLAEGDGAGSGGSLTPIQKQLRAYTHAVQEAQQRVNALVNVETPKMLALIKEHVFEAHPTLVAFGLTAEQDPYNDEDCCYDFGFNTCPMVIIRDEQGVLVNLTNPENIDALPAEKRAEAEKIRDDATRHISHLDMDMLTQHFGNHGWSGLFTRDGDAFFDVYGDIYEGEDIEGIDEFTLRFPYRLEQE